MNKRNILLLGFALVAAAQLAVPAWMIVQREWTLHEGHVFKFRTRPIDPSDAFRGRYVWLGLEPSTVHEMKPSALSPDTDQQWGYNQKGFAVLDTDTNGYACVKRLTHLRPVHETAVQVRVSYWGNRNGEAHLQWTGLDRYYMAEGKAPAAETAYRDHNLRTNQTCYVTIRVRGESAVIENLFIDNMPITDWLRLQAPKK